MKKFFTSLICSLLSIPQISFASDNQANFVGEDSFHSTGTVEEGDVSVQALSNATKTYEMIAIGDSITAGFIGFTQLPAKRQEFATAVESEYEEPLPPGLKWGVRVPAFLESKSSWSWATGSRSNSFALRLQRFFQNQDPTTQARLHWINTSESAAVTAHLPRQVRLAAELKRKSMPDAPISLATVMIGANNACESLGTDPYEAAKIMREMDVTFQRLAQLPKSNGQKLKVYVSSVPNIPILGGPVVMDHRAAPGMTCRQVREKLFDSCPQLVHWNTPEEYGVRTTRVQFINKTLAASVRAARKKYAQLELHYDDLFYRYPLSPAVLARDCFHPGSHGQTVLSELLWDGLPWFKETPLR